MKQTDWLGLARLALEGEKFTRDQAQSVLSAAPSQTLPLVDAAYRVRAHYFGQRVRLNYLFNAKSGLCPEDCHYCSQAKGSEAPIEKYPLQTPEQALAKAARA